MARHYASGSNEPGPNRIELPTRDDVPSDYYGDFTANTAGRLVEQDEALDWLIDNLAATTDSDNLGGGQNDSGSLTGTMKLTDDQSRMLFHSMKTRVVEEHAEYVQKHNADWVLDNTYSQCVIAKHAFLHDLHTELRGFVEQRYCELERRGDES